MVIRTFFFFFVKFAKKNEGRKKKDRINILGPPEIYFGRIRADFSGADPERPKCARNIFRAF